MGSRLSLDRSDQEGQTVPTSLTGLSLDRSDQEGQTVPTSLTEQTEVLAQKLTKIWEWAAAVKTASRQPEH